MNEEKSPFIKALEILLEGERTGQLINFVLIPLLLILTVLLPPISLVDRVLAAGFTTITLAGGSVADPDGTQLTILPQGLSQRIRVRLTSFPRLEFLAGKTEEREAMELIPPYLDMKSPLYLLEVRGPMPEASFLTIPIPNDAEPLATLDIYQWTGEEWQWLPHRIIPEDDVIETWFSSLPRGIAVTQTRLRLPSVACELGEGGTLAGAKSDILARVSARGLFLQSDGLSGEATIGGEIGPLAQVGDYVVIPTLENRVKGAIRHDLTHNILVNEDLRRNHIQEIVALVVENDYTGIRIDYAGIGLSLREDFTAFIIELADQLHAEEKLLTVRVETPVQIAEDRWDTGGYDWEALGRVVDGFQLPALPLPQAYLPGGQMETLLNYVVGVVDRYKVRLTLSAQARDRVGDQRASLSYEEALGLLGSQIALPGEEVSPGQTLTMEPSSLRDWEMQYLEGAHTYWFTHQDERGEHTIFLENAESIAHKLELARAFNLQGVIVKGLWDEGSDQRVWEALSQYAGALPCTIESQFAILWQVADAEGDLVAEEVCSLDDPAFSWTVPRAGEYTISYAISDDGGQTASVVGGEALLVAAAPSPTPTPAPIPATPTPTPPPSTAPTKTPTPTPAPVVRPAPVGTGFNYGIQVHPYNVDLNQLVSAVQGLGFRWVKFQVPWEWLELRQGQRDWNAYGLENAVNAFHNAGIKILLSVVVAPDWSRTTPAPCPDGVVHVGPPDDYNLYADFVGAMAAHFRGRVQAYEIMNETNLCREWNTGRRLSAAEYVDLLSRAYRAIKAVDPNIIVVSGAPTPTGWHDYATAVRDIIYLEEMYIAGVKNWCDAVGVHPSGYNNAPDTRAPYVDPSNTIQRRDSSEHFLDTIEGYYNIMAKYGDGNKRLWATEWGWGACEGMGASPPADYAYFCDNSEQEQADYIVRAFQIAKNSGYMGVMFLWNLNFGPVCGTCEQGYFGIVRPDWSHRPAYNRLASMPK